MKNDLGVYVAVISSGRPQNVEKMQAQIGYATWYVSKGQKQAYQSAGAEAVIESGGLCESRNAALNDAFTRDLPCVQLSDDLQKIEEIKVKGGKPVRLSFQDALREFIGYAKQNPKFYLYGVAPTPNPFYFHKAVSLNQFIVGDFIFVRPSSISFDEKLKLKEDYDFTLAHIKEFGGVVRLNFILPSFLHRKNAGGAVQFRTSDREKEAIAYLKKKWGDAIRDNPRRENEVLLSIKKAR